MIVLKAMYKIPAFERMNEADVRGEVIDPLLHRLGYSSGSDYDIIREQSLRYPRQFLGRKDIKKDPELRGKADYVLEIEKRLTWVIEAKPPSASLRIDDIQQAWTYAIHPDIRAFYFAICNGRNFVVYRTAEGPNAPPILDLSHEELEQKYLVVKNTLSPQALLRDVPKVNLDFGVPLAEGLRSIARVTNGVIRFEHNSLSHPLLNDIQTIVREGAIERDEKQRMVAFVTTIGSSRLLQEFNERLGLASFEMVSIDSQLSTSEQNPNTFVYEKEILFSAGERLPDIRSGMSVTLTENLRCDVRATAEGVYKNGVLRGAFTTHMTYSTGLCVQMSGSFEIHLA
jgi:hypothetical protein